MTFPADVLERATRLASTSTPTTTRQLYLDLCHETASAGQNPAEVALVMDEVVEHLVRNARSGGYVLDTGRWSALSAAGNDAQAARSSSMPTAFEGMLVRHEIRWTDLCR